MAARAPALVEHLVLGICLASVALGGCEFFEELQSEPEDEPPASDESTSETADEGEPCEIASDDECVDQDTLASCSPSDAILRIVSCPQTCGGNTNFSCVGTPTGQHACWCVVPGYQKVLSCTELETCLLGCGEDGVCLDQCFARTDAATIRLYGALLWCAETSCAATCSDAPHTCPECVLATLASGAGGCTLERAVCDDDRNDEPQPW
jgi:hypothetical protein